MMRRIPIYERVKRVLLGAPRDLFDPKIFHNVSLIAFFAWVGLGADGISSSSVSYTHLTLPTIYSV